MSKYKPYLEEVAQLVEAGNSIANAARVILQKYNIEADEDTARKKFSGLLKRTGLSPAQESNVVFKPIPPYPSTKPSSNMATWEENGNNASTTFTVPLSERIKTLEDALKHCQADLTQWEVTNWRFNTWETGSKEKVYQVRISFKRKDPNKVDIRDNINDIINILKQNAPDYKPFLRQPNQDHGNLVEFCAYDLHYGKLCWAPETGENYDSKIAEQRLMTAVVDAMDEVEPYNIDRILFAVGNDFFNVDNAKNTTHAGTPQSEDSRWQKTFLGGVNLLIQAIDYMREFAPVDVVVVQGNHDWERIFYAGVVLEARYANCDNVTIDNTPTARKYYRYGNSLIGMTHGDNEKQTDLPMIMAQECPQDWAETKYREFHVGHFHHNKTRSWISDKDYIGVKVRTLRSLSGQDAWHTSKGYIGNTQSAETYVWSKFAGLRSIRYYNV